MQVAGIDDNDIPRADAELSPHLFAVRPVRKQLLVEPRPEHLCGDARRYQLPKRVDHDGRAGRRSQEAPRPTGVGAPALDDAIYESLGQAPQLTDVDRRILGGHDRRLVVLQMHDVPRAVSLDETLGQPANVLPRREGVDDVGDDADLAERSVGGGGERHDGAGRLDVVVRTSVGVTRDAHGCAEPARARLTRQREHVEGAVAGEVAMADEDDVHAEAPATDARAAWLTAPVRCIP